jgi:hypothetical protein
MTCENAAEHDELGTFQWAVANGCPWNRFHVYWAAKENGATKVMDWLLSTGNVPTETTD